MDELDVIATLKEQRDTAVKALEPFDALWADWFDYCMSGDRKFHTILEWLQGTNSVEKVADWIRIASGVVRMQSGKHDVG